MTDRPRSGDDLDLNLSHTTHQLFAFTTFQVSGCIGFPEIQSFHFFYVKAYVSKTDLAVNRSMPSLGHDLYTYCST